MIPVTAQDYAGWFQLFQGNHIKGAHFLRTLLSSPDMAQMLFEQAGAAAAIFAGANNQNGARRLWDVLADMHYLPPTFNRYLQQGGLTTQETFEKTAADQEARRKIMADAKAKSILNSYPALMDIFYAESKKAIYGVRWKRKENTPQWIRLYDSEGFQAVAANGVERGFSSFDDTYLYGRIQICNLAEGKVTAYEGDADFSRINADVFVEIPRFYYKIISTEDDLELVISPYPHPGFEPAPRFQPYGTQIFGTEKIYIGAYKTTIGYQSRSASYPFVSRSLSQYYQEFSKLQPGYYAIDYASRVTIQMLYLVEFAHWDSQSQIGRGVTSAPNYIKTGSTDILPGHTGSMDKLDYKLDCKYRGLEGLWGNLGELTDGLYIYRTTSYTLFFHYPLDPDRYNSSWDRNSYSGRLYTLNGWINSIGCDKKYPWIWMPDSAISSSASAIPDYYTITTDSVPSSSREYPAVCGGSYNEGGKAGLFALNFTNWNGNAGNTSSRLMYLPHEI